MTVPEVKNEAKWQEPKSVHITCAPDPTKPDSSTLAVSYLTADISDVYEVFVLNIIGLGLGPLVTGILSDVFGADIGPGEGLRWALVVVTLANVWAAAHYFRAARTLREDLARAPA